jgi:MoxR-like ATPase
MTDRTLTRLEVALELPANLRLRPASAEGSAPETILHRFETRERDAINAALAAGRPLLVRGEPGVGKSQLARAAAKGLGWAFVSKVIDARTEARDLLYTFDAVRRLADAQVLSLGRGPEAPMEVEKALDELRYVTPGPLWWAFHWKSARSPAPGVTHAEPTREDDMDPERGVVVLLDELDKADSSVPNGLLEALGHGAFDGPAGHRIEAGTNPPLVVVTTNEERSLPDAFLRRCLVLQLQVPEKKEALTAWLVHRGRGHFNEETLPQDLLKRAAELLVEDRKMALAHGLAPPGAAEYLDLLRVLARSSVDVEERVAYLERVAEFVLKKHPMADPL